MAPEDRGDARHVEVRSVRAAADEDLVERCSRDLPDRNDGVRAVGQRDERLQRGKIDVDGFVVGRVRVGFQRNEVALPAVHLQERTGLLVARKDGRRRAEFGPHVRDGSALVDRERRDAGARVFEDLSDAAARREPAQEFENDVFRGAPGRERSGQQHPDDPGHSDDERMSAHGHRDVESARADREHSEPAARRRVAVGAEERLSGNRKTLQMHEVADAVPGTREIRAELRGRRREKGMVVRVLVSRLERVVIHVAHGAFRPDPRNAHRLELQEGHCPGRVLGQRLIDAQRYLRARFAGRPRRAVRADQLLCAIFSHGCPFSLFTE